MSQKQIETSSSGAESGLMRRREVAALLAVSESTVKRMVRRGDLPKPVVITKGCIGFVSAEVEAWLRKLVRTRNGGPSPN